MEPDECSRLSHDNVTERHPYYLATTVCASCRSCSHDRSCASARRSTHTQTCGQPRSLSSSQTTKRAQWSARKARQVQERTNPNPPTLFEARVVGFRAARAWGSGAWQTVPRAAARRPTAPAHGAELPGHAFHFHPATAPGSVATAVQRGSPGSIATPVHRGSEAATRGA